jgi:hypothetical protein
MPPVPSNGSPRSRSSCAPPAGRCLRTPLLRSCVSKGLLARLVCRQHGLTRQGKRLAAVDLIGRRFTAQPGRGQGPDQLADLGHRRGPDVVEAQVVFGAVGQ